MSVNSPYQIIKRRHITEKAAMLGQLQNADSNKCLARCKSPKYVFIVDPKANKHQIACALEHIYKSKNIRVMSVNTINVLPKSKRRGRFQGRKAHFKKAIVTLAPNDTLD